jgi:hypothetical protein
MTALSGPRATRYAEVSPLMREACRSMPVQSIERAIGCVVEFGENALRDSFDAGDMETKDCLRAYREHMVRSMLQRAVAETSASVAAEAQLVLIKPVEVEEEVSTW